MNNIQGQMKELFGNSCLAYCYAYLFLRTDEVKKLTKAVLYGWYNGYIDDDGFVSKPLEYIKLTSGKEVTDIEKIYINDLSELPEGKMIVVEYKKKPTDKASHFVVACDGVIEFDPSGDSQTVKVGKPFSYRKFIY